MAHFHIPKPLHGWREFVGEVGIIVLGVLIALGAEQAVENIRQRNDVGELRRGIRAELANDRARWNSIHEQEPCELQRLATLDQWARSAPAKAQLADLPGPLIWNLHWSAWDAAKASNALEHISASERLTYSDLYDAMQNQQRYIQASQIEWQNIASLAATADQENSRLQLRQAVARERYEILSRRRVNYDYLNQRFDALSITQDANGLATAGTAADPKALCAPLESVG